MVDPPFNGPTPPPLTPNPTTPAGVSRECILLADDDTFVRAALAGLLLHRGYHLLEADDGLTTLQLALRERPDLIILDVGMPGLSGLEVLARLRDAGCTTPVLILSSKAEVHDRVGGLDVGADDYLGKPFDADELFARVKALLRRTTGTKPPPRHLHLGDTSIDLERLIARRGASEIRLSRTERSLLELLAQHAGQPVSRAMMMEVVWGYASPPNTRTIDTHVWRLRKKLGDVGDPPQWIQNIPGIGYRLMLDRE